MLPHTSAAHTTLVLCDPGHPSERGLINRSYIVNLQMSFSTRKWSGNFAIEQSNIRFNEEFVAAIMRCKYTLVSHERTTLTR